MLGGNCGVITVQFAQVLAEANARRRCKNLLTARVIYADLLTQGTYPRLGPRRRLLHGGQERGDMCAAICSLATGVTLHLLLPSPIQSTPFTPHSPRIYAAKAAPPRPRVGESFAGERLRERLGGDREREGDPMRLAIG